MSVPLDNGFTFATFEVPPGARGTITLDITRLDRPGDTLRGNVSAISVMAFVGANARTTVHSLSWGERVVWASADAGGASVSRSVDARVIYGGASVWVSVDLPGYLEPWGDPNASRRFTMVGISSDPIGSTVHHLERDGAENVTVRLAVGTGARTIIARDFEARGVRVQAGVGALAGLEASGELVHEVRSSCGVTGVFSPSLRLGVHRTDFGYRNDLNESDEFRSVGVGPYHFQDADPTRSLRLIEFASPAMAWTFYAKASAGVGAFVGDTLTYAPLSESGLEADPERCGVEPVLV